MGCIKIDAYSELDFTPAMFGGSFLGYIGSDEEKQSKLIDVEEIVSYERAPLIRVEPGQTSAVNTEFAVTGLRVLLRSGETLVSPKHSLEAFEKTVHVARQPDAIVVTAQAASLIRIEQTISKAA